VEVFRPAGVTRCTDGVRKLEEVCLTGSGVTGVLIPVTATISAPPSGETMHQTSKRFRGVALTSHSAGEAKNVQFYRATPC